MLESLLGLMPVEPIISQPPALRFRKSGPLFLLHASGSIMKMKKGERLYILRKYINNIIVAYCLLAYLKSKAYSSLLEANNIELFF